MEIKVLKSHQITGERFEYSCQFYQMGTTDILEEAGCSVEKESVDEDITSQIQLIMDQQEKLFPNNFQKTQKPDFELKIPAQIDFEIYFKILKKIFACIRHQTYKELRQKMRELNEETQG